jgi:hypothetical protein
MAQVRVVLLSLSGATRLCAATAGCGSSVADGPEAFYLLDDCAATALSENAFRERELALRCDPFVLFGDALDAVARIVGISVRGRNEMANFIGTKDC